MGRKKKDYVGMVNTPKKRRKGTSGVVNGGTPAAAKVLDAAKVEKEFADILNYHRKQSNNLLGVFVGEKYKLSDDAIQELLSLPKRFDRIENNVLYAATILGEFVLNFKVEMDIQPDFCKAKLFLIEIEQGVEEDIKHLSLLSEVVEPYMFEFRNFLCQKWNIFYDDEVIEKSDKLYRYLHMQSEEFLFNRELVELLSQLYVVRMLALLDKIGDVGSKVKMQFKLLVEQRAKLDLSVMQNFTLQKMLLDFVLRNNKGFEEVLKFEDGAKILDGFSTPLKNVRDKTYTTVLENNKKESKATSPVKKAEGKGKVKKKSSPAKDAGGKVASPWEKYKAATLSGVSSPKSAKKEDSKQKELPKENASTKKERPQARVIPKKEPRELHEPRSNRLENLADRLGKRVESCEENEMDKISSLKETGDFPYMPKEKDVELKETNPEKKFDEENVQKNLNEKRFSGRDK